MRKLRVISWNLRMQGDIHKKVELLRQTIQEVVTDASVVIALQEVTPAYQDELIRQRSRLLPHWNFSLDLRQPGLFDSGSRKLGCALAWSADIASDQVGILSRTPFPERTLHMQLGLGAFKFDLIVFHSITGVDFKNAKAAQFASIAEHLYGLSHNNTPLIFCGDANEPEIDHPQLSQSKFWQTNGDRGIAAGGLFGPNPWHHMRDAFRMYLENNPTKFDDIVARRPAGPLDITFNRPTPSRYDVVYVSSHWQVQQMSHRYSDARSAGSDHALVVCDLAVTP